MAEPITMPEIKCMMCGKVIPVWHACLLRFKIDEMGALKLVYTCFMCVYIKPEKSGEHE